MAVFPHSSDSLLVIYGVGAINARNSIEKIKAALNMNRTAIIFYFLNNGIKSFNRINHRQAHFSLRIYYTKR